LRWHRDGDATSESRTAAVVTVAPVGGDGADLAIA
jgi:hypothetical protein